MKMKVGFIGLGAMGKWMALHVAKAGFPLIVYDIRPEAIKELEKGGAAAGSNPVEVAKKSECVLLSLPDTGTVENVIFGEGGLIHGLSPGSIIADLSTIHHKAAVRIEQALGVRGIFFVDAPVTGLEDRAKAATLTVMVGGDPAILEKVRPILNTIGNTIVHMGKTGTGQLGKLVNNLLFNISIAGMAEILPMAVKLGLDPEAVCQVVRTGSGQSFALDFYTPRVLENDFRGFAMKVAYKDMVHAAEIWSEEKIPLPLFTAAMQTYQLALAQGLGDECKAAMIKVWEKALGVEVRKRKDRG